MQEMSWKEYYAGHKDWSFRTKMRNADFLTDFGDSKEVFEVIRSFRFYDPEFNMWFIERALDSGVHFLPEHAVSMTSMLLDPILSRVADSVDKPFDHLQLLLIKDSVDTETFERLVQKSGIDFWTVYAAEKAAAEDLECEGFETEDFEAENLEDEDLEDECIEWEEPACEEFEYEEPEYYEPEPAEEGLGFFGSLLSGFIAAATESGGRHHGRCNGDCANCPPHYGYRYGRWYYGRDHVRGCEFGGNRGSGRRD